MVIVVEYAEWQKTRDEYGNHYIVYQVASRDSCYYVVELDEDLISMVVGPSEYHPNDLERLSFGCYTCDGAPYAEINTIQNREPELCRHREAVITVLKRRRVATKEKDDYYSWVITFAASSERGLYQKGKDMIMR